MGGGPGGGGGIRLPGIGNDDAEYVGGGPGGGGGIGACIDGRGGPIQTAAVNKGVAQPRWSSSHLVVAAEAGAVPLAWVYHRLHCHRCLLLAEGADQPATAHRRLKFKRVSQRISMKDEKLVYNLRCRPMNQQWA